MISRDSPAPPSLEIAQYWDAEDVPDYIEDLFSGFRNLNPDFRHRVFSEAAAERFIDTRFGPREAAAFRACAIPSMQSDYFRYCFVLADGGIYADADYRCVRRLRPLLDECAGGELFYGPGLHRFKGRDTRRVWSAFFAFRSPGHPFLRLALEIATANLEARIAERIWAVGEKVVPAIWLTVGPGVPTLLLGMRECGSFDAFRDQLSGTDAEPFADLYVEAVGDYERLIEAVDSVRVSSYERMSAWVDRPEQPLPYKQTDVHWHNVKSAIFRGRVG